MKKVLAFDFGASSGRAILGTQIDNGEIQLAEIHRFPNDPVRVNGGFYWDVLQLFHEIKVGLTKCVNAGHSDISSIGIDTWGVDYGLLDNRGELIGNPYHYRDNRTDGVIEKVEQLLSRKTLYELTGIQSNFYNTIYQLASSNIPETADKLLFMPDLFAYFLTGKKRCERTIFSTSQLMDIHSRKISDEICDALNINKDLFCPIIEPGESYGLLKSDIANEVGLPQIPVAAVASHDTASAVVAVPFESRNSAFLSCGTWSLLGLKLDKPILTDEAIAAGFTNEAGVNGSIRFLKNITGAWLANECRRIWKQNGEDVSFATLDAQAVAAIDFQSIIDPNSPEFTAPNDMTKAIVDFCVQTNQTPPATIGEFLVLINRSLAKCYRENLDALEKIAGFKIETLHMVGGGIQDKLLCKLTEEITGRKVVAGPVEATAMGNVMVQLQALRNR